MPRTLQMSLSGIRDLAIATWNKNVMSQRRASRWARSPTKTAEGPDLSALEERWRRKPDSALRFADSWRMPLAALALACAGAIEKELHTSVRHRIA